MRVNRQRIKKLHSGHDSPGPVVYWMSRDQRIDDNWALIHAQDLALEHDRPLRIVFCLVKDFLGAGKRQYGFMLKGLEETLARSASLHIPLDLIQGDLPTILPQYLKKIKAGFLVMDFDPLKIKKIWRKQVLKQTNITSFMVDAHNIVPCWTTSDKQEYSARTIRPKIHAKLDEFLEPFPELTVQTDNSQPAGFYSQNSLNDLQIDTTQTQTVDHPLPGPDKAHITLNSFLAERLSGYDQHRNDPNRNALSNLSPYLHFGQICSQTVALKIRRHPKPDPAPAHAFLEELIIRKELSDNYCYYNENHDDFEGLPEWGKKTLDKHTKDQRPYLYSLDEFERGLTHDPLWNAAQMEMIAAGKMHGYMRMYWAKKILEWTENPHQAIEWAILLNNRYQLDGRDPNGYAGIMWSIGGLHDRPWKERNIFGMIRYMSYNGCKRKFNIQEYINRWTSSGRRS